MLSNSPALAGVVGSAPPTMLPRRLLEAINVARATNNVAVKIGLSASQRSGDGALTRSISAFSSASSLRSRADEVVEELSCPRDFVEICHEREIALRARSKASWNCEPLGGTKRAIIREETRRFFLLFRRARIKSWG